MYLIRDIFNTKPGRAKDLVAMVKKAMPHMQAPGIQNMRVMTDTVGGYWTVVCETEVEELPAYFDAARGEQGTPPQGRGGDERLHGAGQRRPPRDLPHRVTSPAQTTSECPPPR